MCEVVLNTGNITLESGIAEARSTRLILFLTCALPGRVRPELVRVSLAPWVRATAMETRTLTRKL